MSSSRMNTMKGSIIVYEKMHCYKIPYHADKSNMMEFFPKYYSTPFGTVSNTIIVWCDMMWCDTMWCVYIIGGHGISLYIVR